MLFVGIILPNSNKVFLPYLMYLKFRYNQTIVAYITGEHYNCLPLIGCLPLGRALGKQPNQGIQFECSNCMEETIV